MFHTVWRRSQTSTLTLKLKTFERREIFSEEWQVPGGFLDALVERGAKKAKWTDAKGARGDRAPLPVDHSMPVMIFRDETGDCCPKAFFGVFHVPKKIRRRIMRRVTTRATSTRQFAHVIGELDLGFTLARSDHTLESLLLETTERYLVFGPGGHTVGVDCERRDGRTTGLVYDCKEPRAMPLTREIMVRCDVGTICDIRRVCHHRLD
jgi:hypothetical protein